MKLLLVDDHALFREGMELVLCHLDPEVQVRHAVNVQEALQVVAQEPGLDLVLLDLHMPGMVGLDALLTMRARAETTPVVVLSGSEDVQIVWQAIEAGAMGFIQKQSDSRTMMAALRVVLGGGIYLPAVCLAGAGRRPAPLPPDLPARERIAQLGLSGRQAETLAKVVQGKPNKVIARELGISEATVKTHLSAVFAALDVHSRTEAVYAIARMGLRLQDFEA
jgi:two-component system nitrate/nitrite response regulator NarL